MATERARRIRGTRVNIGKQVRHKWLEARDIDCEALTFGDLQRGERFIAMPTPGDNSGHSGLLNGTWIFMKIVEVTKKNSTCPLSGNAIRLIDGVITNFNDSNLVYTVQ